MKYSIINTIYNLPFSNYVTGFIKKKLLKNNKITFIPTNKNRLPNKSYPVFNSIEYQEEIINSYNKNNKLSFNTFPDLKYLLKKKFNSDTKFNFLDSENIKIESSKNVFSKKNKLRKVIQINTEEKQLHKNYLRAQLSKNYFD